MILEACEVKEAFLGFDDVSTDRRAAAIFFWLFFLFPFIHVCLFYMAYSQYCLVSLCSTVSAQLWHPKMLTGAPLMVNYKKVFDVMLHLEAEWPSKQNT